MTCAPSRTRPTSKRAWVAAMSSAAARSRGLETAPTVMAPEPCFLEAEWRHLVMLSYEIDRSILAGHVPAGCELDAWSGRTFVSMVGFRFLGTRVLGIAVPFHRDFEEVNLRFYVRRRAEGA